METLCPTLWPRAIIHVDMNAFFASVEQRDFPELRGRPIAVTNGRAGSTIITCSYEARAFGIHTGMRLQEARRLCPELVQRPTRPKVYAETSAAIMASLERISPDIEVFSVDEAFLDVTQCQRLYGTPPRMGQMVKETVFAASGLLCSVGVGGDKTTAKFAAKQQKPDGLTVIPPWEAARRLAAEPTTALCGIGKGIGAYLAEHGVLRCGDVAQLPISTLSRRFGNKGRRIWLMCQGADPEPLLSDSDAPKSVGHGKVLPPGTRRRQEILVFLRHMSEKVAARLRRHELVAGHYAVGLKGEEGWVGAKWSLPQPDNDGHAIFALCLQTLAQEWDGGAVAQIQVTALDPQPAQRQFDLFAPPPRHESNRVMDAINQRYGDFALTPARLIKRTEMPDVIAPAWKPHGHRRTV